MGSLAKSTVEVHVVFVPAVPAKIDRNF